MVRRQEWVKSGEVLPAIFQSGIPFDAVLNRLVTGERVAGRPTSFSTSPHPGPAMTHRKKCAL